MTDAPVSHATVARKHRPRERGRLLLPADAHRERPRRRRTSSRRPPWNRRASCRTPTTAPAVHPALSASSRSITDTAWSRSSRARRNTGRGPIRRDVPIRGFRVPIRNGRASDRPPQQPASRSLEPARSAVRTSRRTSGAWRPTLRERLAQYARPVELDPKLKDAGGVPALRINITWGDRRMHLFPNSAEAREGLLRAAGAEGIRNVETPRRPRSAADELGSAWMDIHLGRPVQVRSAPANHARETSNWFLRDGAALSMIACVNPTTMLLLPFKLRSAL